MFQLESRDDLNRILTFPLVKVKTTIGRDPASDIVLEDEDVSRHHVRIYVMGDAVKIKDEGSANGTYVNNMQISDLVDLPVGAEVIIGSNQFFLRHTEDPIEEERLQLTTMLSLDQLRDMTKRFDSLLDEVPSGADHQPTTTIMDKQELLQAIYHKKISFKAHSNLEIIFGPDKGKKYLLTPGDYRLGRGSNCNVRLSDPMVSGLHGSIEVNENKFIYTDEGSRNGSILNNKIVMTHPLQHRDVLVLGNTKLKFVNPAQARDKNWQPETVAATKEKGNWLAHYGIWVTVGIAALVMIVLLIEVFLNR